MDIDFRLVVDALPGLVWITRDDGDCRHVNRTWRDYTGLDHAASHGLGWHAAIHPEDLPTLRDTWSDIRRTGADREIYVRLRRSDAEYRWFTLRPAAARQRAGAGRTWCWLGNNADEGTVTDGRLRRLFDMLPMQAAFLNQAGTSEFSNQQTLQDYGMTLEELAAWQTSGAIHVDDHPKVIEQLTRLMTTGEMFDATLRMRYKDGTYRWMRCRCVPCRDAQGNIVRYVTVQSDVHELKHAEDLLAAEVEILEMVARGEPLGRVLEALASGIEGLCADSACGVLRIVGGRTQWRVAAGPGLPPGAGAAFEAMRVEAGDTPCSRAVLDRAPVLVVDLAADPRWDAAPPVRRLAGLGIGMMYVVPIESASGQASGVVALCRPGAAGPGAPDRDVVERFTRIAGIAIDRAEADAARLSSERELRVAHAQFSEGQRLSRTGTFTSDLRRRQLRGSDEFCRIFEVDPGAPPELDTIRARIHPDDMALFDAELRRLFERGATSFDFRAVTPGAGPKSLRGVAQVMAYTANRRIVMGAVQDISERKRADDALQRARSELAHVARVATLNAMAASIAHEVSQPLTGILTNASIVAHQVSSEPPDAAGAAETIRRMSRDANRAIGVVTRLRAMFSNKASVFEALDLNQVTGEVLALCTNELQQRRALLQTDFRADLPAVQGDRVQLQQVILNLLLNAADAMAQVADRPRILSVSTGVHDDAAVTLAVRDAGVGLDDQGLARIFEAFYTTKPGGMGIGLSISRSIIESHDGQLWAQANDGPGATFAFSLPRAGAAAPPSARG